MFFPLNIFCQSFNFSESDFTDVDKVSKSCIVLFAETKLYFSPLTLFVSFLAILTYHMLREAGDGLTHVPGPSPGREFLNMRESRNTLRYPRLSRWPALRSAGLTPPAPSPPGILWPVSSLAGDSAVGGLCSWVLCSTSQILRSHVEIMYWPDHILYLDISLKTISVSVLQGPLRGAASIQLLSWSILIVQNLPWFLWMTTEQEPHTTT